MSMVENLRDLAEVSREIDRPDTAGAVDEAANEIERLATLLQSREALIGRLVGALAEIATIRSGVARQQDTLNKARTIAHKALTASRTESIDRDGGG